MRSRHVSDKQQEEKPVCRELQAICETLELPEARGSDAAELFSQIQFKVGQYSAAYRIYQFQHHQKSPVIVFDCNVIREHEICIFINHRLVKTFTVCVYVMAFYMHVLMTSMSMFPVLSHFYSINTLIHVIHRLIKYLKIFQRSLTAQC